MKIKILISLAGMILFPWTGLSLAQMDEDPVGIISNLPQAGEKWEKGLTELQASMEKLKEKNEVLQKENEKLKASVEELRAQYLDVRSGESFPGEPKGQGNKSGGKLDVPTTSQLRHQEDEINKLKLQKVSLQDEIMVQTKKQNALKEESGKLKEEIARLEQEIKSIGKDSALQEQNRDRSLKSYNHYKDEITPLAQEQKKLREEIASLESANRSIQEEKEKLHAQIGQTNIEKEKTLKALDEDILKLSGQSKDLQGQLSALQLEEKKLKALTAKSSSVDEAKLNEKIQALQTDNKVLEQEISALMDIIVHLNDEKAKVESVLEKGIPPSSAK